MKPKLLLRKTLISFKRIGPIKEITNFIKQTNHILFRIEENPMMYMASPKSRFIHKAHINKYIILYFRYYASKKK